MPESTIKIELGTTLNIGNFSNIKVSVGIEEKTTDDVHKAMRELHDMMENELIISINDLLDRFDKEGIEAEDPFD